MGDEADDILLSFNLTPDEMKQYDVVKNKFENHFIAKRNVIYERAKFNVRIQNEGEPVESFITDLHCLAEHCEFGTLKDQLIRDRIVVGLRNKQLSEKLQLDPDLTLEKAMFKVKQSEEVKKQQRVIHSKAPNGHNIDNISKNRPRGPSHRDETQHFHLPGSKLSKFADRAKCTRCLGNVHPRKLCPASDSVCKKCSKKDIGLKLVAVMRIWVPHQRRLMPFPSKALMKKHIFWEQLTLQMNVILPGSSISK